MEATNLRRRLTHVLEAAGTTFTLCRYTAAIGGGVAVGYGGFRLCVLTGNFGTCLAWVLVGATALVWAAGE